MKQWIGWPQPRYNQYVTKYKVLDDFHKNEHTHQLQNKDVNKQFKAEKNLP